MEEDGQRDRFLGLLQACMVSKADGTIPSHLHHK